MLTLENVTYRYKRSQTDVLKGISAQFETGKVNAIVGPSGSGKTTLLSILAGMDSPHGGGVYIGEDNLANLDLNQYRRSRIAMIFQAFHLFPLLTAIENVCYPLEASGARQQDALAKAKPLLDAVGITQDKWNRFPANLSGGEQQRVAIARALSVGAKVLLADEPTGNLDTINSDIVVDILQKLAHDHGYCVVIVTHNPDIANISDNVFTMKEGELT